MLTRVDSPMLIGSWLNAGLTTLQVTYAVHYFRHYIDRAVTRFAVWFTLATSVLTTFVVFALTYLVRRSLLLVAFWG
jgi:hypothetical protein